MKINKIILNNFGLFKDQEINLDQTNLITGTNLDTLENDKSFSSNGSGKSTIISAILFSLFGESTNVNLKDLIRLNAKECSVELYCSLNNEHLKIIRKIPASLQIFLNDNLVQFNTQTIAQNYINELIGTDLNKFRTYNIIDNAKGINLLDLGITSLRKALMEFVNEQFLKIRQSLLSQKLERETYNVNKKLYTFYLSTKRQSILESGLIQLNEQLQMARKDLEDEANILSNFKSDISSREKIIFYKEAEAKKAKEGICPILKQTCDRIGSKMTEEAKLNSQKEITQAQEEIVEIKTMLKAEEEAYNYFKSIVDSLDTKIRKTKEFMMKLKEAQKFSAYKYTIKDVQLYADSIKVLDSFSGYYITQWLETLAIIINDLLKPLNISIEFTSDRDFLSVNNAGQILKYEMLSSGQKKFLGTIFKIGILLQEGINEGILIFDEGLGDIDAINLTKLIDILKSLNFQTLLIYQNIDKSITDVNYINIERKNNESRIL